MNLAQFIANGMQAPFSRFRFNQKAALPHHQHPASNAVQKVRAVVDHQTREDSLPRNAPRQDDLLALLRRNERMTPLEIQNALRITWDNTRGLIWLMCSRNRIMRNPGEPVTYSLYIEGRAVPAPSGRAVRSKRYEAITDYLRGKPPQRARDIGRALGLTDQAVSVLLLRMVSLQMLVRTGPHMKFLYSLPEGK